MRATREEDRSAIILPRMALDARQSLLDNEVPEHQHGHGFVIGMLSRSSSGGRNCARMAMADMRVVGMRLWARRDGWPSRAL